MGYGYIMHCTAVLLAVLALSVNDTFGQEQRLNVSYGTASEQIMDLYIPESDGNSSSKVIVYIHGGSWSGGDKVDMNEFIPFLKTAFPSYAIANINYRLGNASNPGFPKQVQDIDLALKFIASELQLSTPQFTLFGGSAGAHLSMLYAYGFDKNQTVKVVVNVVGPADFLDISYALNPIYNRLLFPFVGPYYFFQNATIYKQTSPVTYITAKSPPTISFYGLTDPLVPTTQGPILKAKLDKVKVATDLSLFLGGHYYDWSDSDKQKMKNKTVNFLKLHF